MIARAHLAALLRWIARHHRDLVALFFFLVLYPRFTNEGHVTPASRWWPALTGAWAVLGALGVVANALKLHTLDGPIREAGLQAEVRAPALRFLAGTVALPLLLLLPLFMGLGEKRVGGWYGPIYLVVAAGAWLAVTRFGRGAERPAAPRWRARLATALLVLFELHVYTLFLESLWVADPGFTVTVRSVFVGALPMSVLFALLLLPATIGFYVERCVRHRSAAVAGGWLWLEFLIFRYLPTFALFYLEQHGLRLPWIR